MIYFLQEKLIFLPTQLPQEYQYSFSANFEEVFLETDDGARLNALHFHVKNPKGLILYFHGNAGDLSRWGEIALFFVDKGYDVLIMDYRTYGKSTGKLGEKPLYQDAQLWYEHAKKQYDESNIKVYGRSLGGTFATHVAAKNNPHQLILETPFYGLEEVAKERFPFLPVGSLLKYRFPTYSFINEVKCPITIIHGTEDSVVPFDSGKRLFESISSQKKSFVAIKDGDHNDLINFQEYHKVIDKTLQSNRGEDR